MADNRTQQEIDIGLSQRSKSDLENLQKGMKATAATVAQMVSDMKAFQNLLKSDKLNAMAQTVGGTAAYRRGSAVREQISADRTSAMGTPAGQQIATAREQVALMKQGVALTREEARYRAGMLTNYSQEVGLIRQVKTIQEAKARMSAIEARMGIDRQAGAMQEVTTGQRFLNVYQQRIERLKEINRLEAQSAAATNRRTTQLGNLRNPDLEMARARADAGRQNTQMRLFGDGGAGLLKIQMGLMANYAALNMVTGSLREAVRFSVEFDDSLRNLQAITVLTHGGLSELEGTLIGVADETKFSAVELANAAVTLGQAGLSIEQVKSSISSVALLATATGTDLAKAVDIATSTLGVFNMEASEMGRVADVMTSAVNSSKLNMEKLTLGLQYAGNIAAQSGVSFDELTASFGAMANAGIRSGSTLGTGMRQILIALQKPSKEFKATLDRLGLTMFDVDLRSKGLYGAMKNLRDAGFTAGDAIRSFEVRAAAAFNALAGNLETMLELEQGFIDSSAAARANETQMQSLSNQSKRFTANLGAVVTIGIKPMTLAARDMLQWLADAMSVFKDYPEVLRTVVVGFTSLVTTFAAVKIGSLAFGLLKGQVSGATTALATHIAAARLASITHGGLGASALVAGTALRAMLGPIGFIATSIGIGMLSMRSFTNETEKMNDALDKARTQFDNSAGAAEKTSSQIKSIEGVTESLRDRYELLTGDSRLLELETQKVKSQFAEMGLKVDENVTSVDQLINMLHALRGELREKFVIQMETNLKDGELLGAQLGNKLANSRSALGEAFRKASVVRSGSRGMAIPDNVAQAISVGSDPNAKADALTDQITSLAKSLEDQQTSFRLKNPGQKFVKDENYLLTETMLGMLREVLTNQKAFDAVQMEIAQSARLRDNAVQMTQAGPAGVQASIDALSPTTVSGALDAALRGPGGELLRDPIKEAENAQVIEAEFRERIAAIQQTITDLVSSGLLSPENEQELRTQLGQAESTLDTAMEPIEEAAAEAEEESRKWQSAVSARVAAILNSRLEKAETPQEVDAIAEQIMAEVTKQRDIDMANAGDDMAARVAAGSTFQDAAQGVRDSAAERKADILDKVTETLQATQDRLTDGAERFDEDLARRMEEISDPDLINRITSQRNEAAIQLMDAQLATLEEIEAAGGEVGPEAYDALFKQFFDWMRSIAEDGDAALERIKEESDDAAADAVALEVKALEEQNAILSQMETNLNDLADRALDLKSRNTLLTKALEIFKQKAANALRIINLESPADASDDNGSNGRQVEVLDLETEGTLAGYQGKLNEPFKRPGGRGKKDKDPIEEFVRGAEARIQAMTIGMEAGVTDPKAGLAKFQSILDEARGKVEEIAGQMGALQSRMLNGTLTAAEQEKLNTLVKQHVELTGFLKDNESDLLDLKIEQEGVMANLTPLIQRWAEANLDMTQAAVSGIESILSGVMGSFSTLFKDLTNGAKSGKEAFRDFGISVIKSIQEVMAKMLAMYVLQKLVGMLPGGAFKSLASSALGLKEGGNVTKAKGMAAGGDVTGNLNRDSVTRTLMPDEYVLRRSAAQAIGKDELDKINGMGNTRRSEIGHKGVAKPMASTAPPSNTNVWVVSPDQQPVMGPNDILAVIGQDISRGGSIKKMIKSVQNGSM